MVENSGIEWTDHTFNPWVGCTKVSPACDHCYAETWAKRTGNAELWQGDRRRTSAANWRQPLKWQRDAKAAGVRAKVFCASLADVFDNRVSREWRAGLWDLIRATPDLDWLLLTKRPVNITAMLPAGWGDGWPNVWLGTTVENQEEAARRIPHLTAVPARIRFLSCEPLLGPVTLSTEWMRALDWIIAGGESGPHARPMHADWVRALRNQCQTAGLWFFFKQWGEWAPHRLRAGGNLGRDIRSGQVVAIHPTAETALEVAERTGGRGSIRGTYYVARVGKSAAGATLDGREWREAPGD